MPYKIRKRGDCHEVVNAETGKVHAKCTTRAKAQAQIRAIEAREQGWKPDRVKTLSNGTRVELKFTGKRGKRGTKRS